MICNLVGKSTKTDVISLKALLKTSVITLKH